MDKSYFYAFIRKDLPEAQRIIQATHAAWEMALSLPPSNDPPASMVLFEVEDQTALLTVAEYLDKHIRRQFVVFYEPDSHWSPDEKPAGFTAIATRPMTGEERGIFSRFKLYQAD